MKSTTVLLQKKIRILEPNTELSLDSEVPVNSTRQTQSRHGSGSGKALIFSQFCYSSCCSVYLINSKLQHINQVSI